MEGKPRSIDSYLAGLKDNQRAALQRLREAIQKAAPGSEEGFGYGLPAFRFRGKLLVAFGAAKAHCALYPMSPRVLEAYREELKGFDTSKGAIRFQPAHPLSTILVQKIVKARIREITDVQG